jgi:hypothetical protein
LSNVQSANFVDVVFIYPKRGSIPMKFSMTGQKKGDLLIQVTAWEGLIVYQTHEKAHKEVNIF